MKKTNLIMRIVPIAVFAAIFVYIGVYVFRAVDDPFSTATATLYTVYASVETRGVVVREEECIIYPGGMVSISAEDGSRVAAGGALAVDRVRFASHITDALRAHPLIDIVEEEATRIPDGIAVIAE